VVRNFKSAQDSNEVRQLDAKIIDVTVLNADLDDHLGYVSMKKPAVIIV